MDADFHVIKWSGLLRSTWGFVTGASRGSGQGLSGRGLMVYVGLVT